MGRIAIVSAALGAGHDGAAHEIGRRLQAAGHQVTCHDFLDLVPWGIGRRLRTAYRRQLDVAPGSWERLLNLLQRNRKMFALTVWLSACAARAMLRVFGSDVAAVVCTYPLAGQVAARLRRRGRLSASVVVYLTDPSVHPLWIADGTDLYLAAHPEIAAQLRSLGAERIAVVAPAVRPTFRPVVDAAERALARAAFGLPTDGLLALVVSGSWAVGEIEQSAREVTAGGVATPVVVCGENSALRERLRDLTTGVVLGWVDDMPGLLRACDIVVLNSGGLTFFEAHATALPVLTYRCLAGHGRTNAVSLEHAGLASWPRDADELTAELARFAATRSDPPAVRPSVDVGTVCPTVAITSLLRTPTQSTPNRVEVPDVNRLTAATMVAGVGAVAAHALPAATFWPQLRAHLLPGLAGIGDRRHVALTFDDGPHPRSTPFFLRELDRYGVRATFFVLGSELARTPRLGREMAAAGHEIALHGWHHRRLVWYGHRRTYDELARGLDLIEATTGVRPLWFRPPYGVLTTSALLAARRLELRPVLWTCWGRDWNTKSTPDSVFHTVSSSLTGGGTVLLHDSDVAASVGAWQSTLGALPRLLDECALRGWTVGPLREHGVPGVALPVGRPTPVQSTGTGRALATTSR